jgi:hypothetical protein
MDNRYLLYALITVVVLSLIVYFVTRSHSSGFVASQPYFQKEIPKQQPRQSKMYASDGYFEKVTQHERDSSMPNEDSTYNDFIKDANIDEQTIENHKNWASDMGKWSMSQKKMANAEFDPTQSVPFTGLRRLYGVEQRHNPFSVQELSGSDFKETKSLRW